MGADARAAAAPPLTKMAQILCEQRVIDEMQAGVLSQMMIQLERRAEQWDTQNMLAMAVPDPTGAKGARATAPAAAGRADAADRRAPPRRGGGFGLAVAEPVSDVEPFAEPSGTTRLIDKAAEFVLSLGVAVVPAVTRRRRRPMARPTARAWPHEQLDDERALRRVRAEPPTPEPLDDERADDGASAAMSLFGAAPRRRRPAGAAPTRTPARAAGAGSGARRAARGRARASPADEVFAHQQQSLVKVVTKGLRPALCIRILGTDYDDDHTVYVIWVLDVLSGAEWRVARRFRAFHELHERLIALRPSMEKLDFPTRRPSLYETLHTVADRRVRLERYLRRVAGMLFYARLHATSAAIAHALQAFLEVPVRGDSLELLQCHPHGELALRQCVQVAVYQILTLPVFEKILSDFVGTLQTHPFDSGREMLAMMKAYIDHLQQCLLDGCHEQLRAVVLRRRDASPTTSSRRRSRRACAGRSRPTSSCRSWSGCTTARRHDRGRRARAPVQGALRARLPQSFTGIPVDHISPSSWESAVFGLAAIADAHALPCDKLGALLAAAKEIPALYVREHPHCVSARGVVEKHLGADDFLPIFIYVLVNADIHELACLNCVLTALCDPDKRLSETGCESSARASRGGGVARRTPRAPENSRAPDARRAGCRRATFEPRSAR